MSTIFIATSYGNSSIPKYYRELARGLSKHGHKVVLIYDGHAKINNECDFADEYVWPSKRPTKLKDAFYLYKLIKKYKPDSMMANFGSVNLVGLVGWLSKVKVRIAWYHTTIAQLNMDTKPKGWKHLRKRLLYKQTITTLIPVSNYAKMDLVNYYEIPEERCIVKYNLLENRDIKIEKETNSIVCAGRLDNSKGQDVLIRAIARLKNSIPDIKVYFLGDGKMKDSYLALAKKLDIADRCIFMGLVSNEQVIEKFASSDVCVVPSLVDNLPTVSLEAQSVGTPVVISNAGGMPETIEEGRSGFLFEPGNDEDLAKKLGYLLKNRDILKIMSENAKEVFLEKFSYRNIESYCEFFEGLIDNEAG